MNDKLATGITCIIFLMLCGCVAHAPVSESIIFHDNKTTPSHSVSSGFGAGTSFSPSRSTDFQLAEMAYPKWSYRSEDLPLNPNRYSLGIYSAHFAENGSYAVSFTSGILVAGVDATFKLWKRNYVTAAYSIPQHGQLYLQHRTLNKPGIGLALGMGYQRSAFTFSVPGGGFGEIESKEIHTFGLRGFAIIRDESYENTSMKLGSYIGYAPFIKRPVIQITFIVGRL